MMQGILGTLYRLVYGLNPFTAGLVHTLNPKLYGVCVCIYIYIYIHTYIYIYIYIYVCGMWYICLPRFMVSSFSRLRAPRFDG